MSDLFAGLDVSTQSCKIVVIDFNSNKVIYVDTINYDEDLPHYKTKNGVTQDMPEGISESDPNMWLEALEVIFSRLRDSDIPHQHIQCISVSGQQHGLVTLDSAGNLTRPHSKLWNDFSTNEECEILTDEVGGLEAMIEEVGNSQRTGYTAPKILHMFRHEAEAYQKTATMFLVHNYINFYLTGGVRVMEPGDTSGMALWHPKTATWSKKVINAIDPGLLQKLPEVKPADQTIGFISKELVQMYGFSRDCRIDAGSGDNMYGAIGTGNVQPGIVTVSLGTSGTAYSFVAEPFIDPSGEIAAFCDSTGHHLPLLCVSNLANGYNDIIKLYNITHEAFNEIIKLTPAGNNGRLLIPWYMGERTPDVPQAAPVYFGFGLNDFTKDKLCRAILEGHILNLYDGFQRMPITVEEIRLTGGLSKSEAWCQAIADIFEADTIPVEGEGAAMGAALHAAWVWLKESGKVMDIAEIVKPFIILDEKRRKKPTDSNRQIYRIQKRLYQALSRRNRGLMGEDPFQLRMEMC